MAVGGRNRKVAEAFAKNGGKRLDGLSSPVVKFGLHGILALDVMGPTEEPTRIKGQDHVNFGM